jgi:hypothetical protein
MTETNIDPDRMPLTVASTLNQLREEGHVTEEAILEISFMLYDEYGVDKSKFEHIALYGSMPF